MSLFYILIATIFTTDDKRENRPSKKNKRRRGLGKNDNIGYQFIKGRVFSSAQNVTYLKKGKEKNDTFKNKKERSTG